MLPSRSASPHARRSTLIAGAALAVTALSFGAASAIAAPSGPSTTGTAGAETHHFGAKPLHPTTATHAARQAVGPDTLSLTTNDKHGAVSPTPKVYLVFWGKQWAKDPAKVAPDMQAMFKGLYGSADTWGTIMNQYCEGLAAGTTNCGSAGTHVMHPTSSPLAGVWFDNGSNEPSSASQAQLAAEAVKAAGHFGNKTQTPNLNAQYVILSPHGTNPDDYQSSTNGFCAWHDSTPSSYGTIAYTNLPYVPDEGAGACTTLTDGRLLSGIESTETHEYAETVTDFWPTNGWNNTANGEIGDECINLDAYLTLTTGKFDVQGLWSNAANKCVTHG